MKPIEHRDEPAEEPMDSVRDFASGWLRFWFAPRDPTTIGLMRLVSGIVIFYVYFCYSFDLLSYVSPKEAWLDQKVTNFLRTEYPLFDFPDDWPGRKGVPPQLEVDKGQSSPDFPQSNAVAFVPQQIVVDKGQGSWSIFFHLKESGEIWTAHLLVLLAMLLFTVGFATRITSVLTFLGAVSYIWRAQTSLYGMDAIIVVLLCYLAIAPSGAALSVDRWLAVRRERKRLRNPNAQVPLPQLCSATFATRLLQINFCLIYFASGTSKLLGAAWWNGTALWACYANYSFAPMRVPLYMDFLIFLCQHRWLWEIVMSGAAIFTLFLELGFPFLIWNKRLRWLMLSGAVLLHTGIALFMGLVTFSLMMLCLVLSFVPPEAARLSLGRIAANCRRLRQLIYGTAPVAGKTLPVPAQSI